MGNIGFILIWMYLYIEHELTIYRNIIKAGNFRIILLYVPQLLSLSLSLSLFLSLSLSLSLPLPLHLPLPLSLSLSLPLPPSLPPSLSPSLPLSRSLSHRVDVNLLDTVKLNCSNDQSTVTYFSSSSDFIGCVINSSNILNIGQ